MTTGDRKAVLIELERRRRAAQNALRAQLMELTPRATWVGICRHCAAETTPDGDLYESCCQQCTDRGKNP